MQLPFTCCCRPASKQLTCKSQPTGHQRYPCKQRQCWERVMHGGAVEPSAAHNVPAVRAAPQSAEAALALAAWDSKITTPPCGGTAECPFKQEGRSTDAMSWITTQLTARCLLARKLPLIWLGPQERCKSFCRAKPGIPAAYSTQRSTDRTRSARDQE